MREIFTTYIDKTINRTGNGSLKLICAKSKKMSGLNISHPTLRAIQAILLSNMTHNALRAIRVLPFTYRYVISQRLVINNNTHPKVFNFSFSGIKSFCVFARSFFHRKTFNCSWRHPYVLVCCVLLIFANFD